MAQTTVNQFFVARKSSLPVHPSKKRKVDASDTELNDVKKKMVSRKTSRSSRGKHKQIIQQPVENVPKPLKLINTPEKTIIAIDSVINKSPMGKLKLNEVINDQAKTILHSRGNAILQSSLQGKVSSSPTKASQVLLSMSPQKGNYQQGELAIVEDSSLQTRRDQLRKKYSNLLGDDSSTTIKEMAVNQKVKESEKNSSKMDSQRNQLRNKYKHLLKKEVSSETQSSSSTNSISTNLSPSKKTISSPQKAHEKYKHLTEKNVTSTFPLPQKFKLLLEMFRCVDSVLYLLQQRSEVCTFDRLKKSVQSMCGREFDRKHLEAMKTVYPTGFTFRQERGLYSSSGKTINFQLTIEPDYKDMQLSKSSMNNNSAILITRRLKFENKLLEISKGHHQKFLRKLNLKIDSSEIHRWHPHFKLEDIPDIEQSALPKPPITKSFSSAADLLLKNQNFAPKVANALEKASAQTPNTNNTETKDSKPQSSHTSSTNKAKQNNILKGVSSDLLERIRQKEQKKIELAMTRNPKQELRISRMERLPEISRIVKSYFVAEKKAAITLEDCVQKLTESYGTDLHRNNLEEHIRLLAEVVPKSVQILPVRKCLYVKLAKNFDINNVINTLADVKKREEEKV